MISTSILLSRRVFFVSTTLLWTARVFSLIISTYSDMTATLLELEYSWRRDPRLAEREEKFFIFYFKNKLKLKAFTCILREHSDFHLQPLGEMRHSWQNLPDLWILPLVCQLLELKIKIKSILNVNSLLALCGSTQSPCSYLCLQSSFVDPWCLSSGSESFDQYESLNYYDHIAPLLHSLSQ